MVGDAGRDDDLARRMAVEHRGLVAIETPAVRRLGRRGLDMREIEARRALRMREGETQRTVGDLGQDRLLLRLAAAFGDQAAPITTVARYGSATSPRPNASITMPVSTEPRAEPAILFSNRQRQPAEIGELFPDRRAVAERIARAAAAVIGVIGFRDEAVDTFAQQALLVAQGEVHLICFARIACYRRLTPGRFF